jgi:hypothetical protein
LRDAPVFFREDRELLRVDRFAVELLRREAERFRAPPRFAADFLAALLRPPFLRAEVLRLRELLFFLPPVEPPRDDFLAAAMIGAPG